MSPLGIIYETHYEIKYFNKVEKKRPLHSNLFSSKPLYMGKKINK